MIGPPNVYSYVGTLVFSFVSRGYAAPSAQASLASRPHAATVVGTTAVRLPGTAAPAGRSVSDRQLSLLYVSRNEPLNELPPDFVMTLITPPVNRPNSADTPAVATVVS